MLRTRQFFTLAGLAALETVRQPICILLTGAYTLLCGAVPLLLLHNFGEDGKLARDGGLALHYLFGVFITAHAAGNVLSREIRSGTASAVLSKPVGREMLFAAKYAGVAAVVVCFSACAAIATLLGERVAETFVLSPAYLGYVMDAQTGRMLVLVPFAACLLAGFLNYAARRPFGSTAMALLLLGLLCALFTAGWFNRLGVRAPFDLQVQWRIVPASLLITLALLALAAVSMALSTRLDTAANLTACGFVFLVGLMSDSLFGRYAGSSTTAAVLYRLVPNWQQFWVADALNAGGSIPWGYVWNAGRYAAVLTAGMLLLGVVSFRHAELK